jgi:hypothetical protein
MRSRIVAALNHAASTDPDPILRGYAARISEDILGGDGDHAPDPIFVDEP